AFLLFACTQKEETGIEPAPVRKDIAKSAKASGLCADTDKHFYSKYFIHNNIWGKNETGAGWQCVWEDDGPGWWAWGADAGHQKGNNQIKGYPSCVLGWHWGTWSSNSGLPKQINSLNGCTSSWRVSVPNSGIYNTSYDLWFHNTGNPGYNNPNGELMVWINKRGDFYPAGSYKENVNIAGHNWNVYQGTINSWTVVSLVRTSNTNAVSNLDLKALTHYARNKGWFDGNWHLTSVQSGWEIIEGGSGFQTQQYNCDVW
ncbi:MAG: hypothetical protein MUD08_02850, partial [Cytophagales bacterium]|nr:hypothetical protein [Cytophagales bacterium]